MLPRMAGWETVLAAVGGLVLGTGLIAFLSRQRERRWMRRRVELETRLRRVVVPVLERRADALGIPTAQRGRDEDGAVELTLTLAEAIKQLEESAELPFGDTVEVARRELEGANRTRTSRKRGRA